MILEKQWLRSPLAGLVSDVRVKSVTVKGVSVEVMILEEADSKNERDDIFRLAQQQGRLDFRSIALHWSKTHV